MAEFSSVFLEIVFLPLLPLIAFELFRLVFSIDFFIKRPRYGSDFWLYLCFTMQWFSNGFAFYNGFCLNIFFFHSRFNNNIAFGVNGKVGVRASFWCERIQNKMITRIVFDNDSGSAFTI